MHSDMLNYLRSSVYTLTVPLILTIFPVDFKKARACQLSDMCRTRLFQLSRLYIGTRKMEK